MPIPEFRDDGWLPNGHHNATWEEVVARFGGEQGSRRESVTRNLLALRDGLRKNGVQGYMVLNGSYVSTQPEPGDFDVLLVANPSIAALRDSRVELSRLLDHEEGEANGYSLLYAQTNTPTLDDLKTIWDVARSGVSKGVLEVVL